MSVCYLYVLPLAYEDILKVGISHDPFTRALAFSRRYYEFFDLSRSLLVEFDSRKQAQARETALHRHLRDWNAVQPITVPRAAAGKREWYRGAYDTVLAQIECDEAEGRVVHQPALPWWQARLGAERERMYEWLAQVSRECAGELHTRMIADTLGGYVALGVSLRDVLLPDALEVLVSNATVPTLATLS